LRENFDTNVLALERKLVVAFEASVLGSHTAAHPLERILFTAVGTRGVKVARQHVCYATSPHVHERDRRRVGVENARSQRDLLHSSALA
jgi:hypothetical protein